MLGLRLSIVLLTSTVEIGDSFKNCKEFVTSFDYLIDCPITVMCCRLSNVVKEFRRTVIVYSFRFVNSTIIRNKFGMHR